MLVDNIQTNVNVQMVYNVLQPLVVLLQINVFLYQILLAVIVLIALIVPLEFVNKINVNQDAIIKQ